jgi:hypothetical protein
MYREKLSSDLNCVINYLKGVLLLKVAEKRPELERNTIFNDFKKAILYCPEYSA